MKNTLRYFVLCLVLVLGYCRVKGQEKIDSIVGASYVCPLEIRNYWVYGSYPSNIHVEVYSGIGWNSNGTLYSCNGMGHFDFYNSIGSVTWDRNLKTAKIIIQKIISSSASCGNQYYLGADYTKTIQRRSIDSIAIDPIGNIGKLPSDSALIISAKTFGNVNLAYKEDSINNDFQGEELLLNWKIYNNSGTHILTLNEKGRKIRLLPKKYSQLKPYYNDSLNLYLEANYSVCGDLTVYSGQIPFNIVSSAPTNISVTPNDPNCAGELGSLTITSLTFEDSTYTNEDIENSLNLNGNRFQIFSSGIYTDPSDGSEKHREVIDSVFSSLPITIEGYKGNSTYHYRVAHYIDSLQVGTWTDSLSFELNKTPLPIEITPPSLVNPKCTNEDNGEISIIATGGGGGFTYSKGSGSFVTTSKFTDLVAGEYALRVKDSNGCFSDVLNVNLANPDPISFSQAEMTDSIKSCAIPDGIITVQANGGTGDFQYSYNGQGNWTSLSSSAEEFTGLSYGNYIITARDANNCETTSDEIPLEKPSDVQLSISEIIDVTRCNENNGSLKVNASEDISPYTFELYSGTSLLNTINGDNALFENQPAGNYTLKVTPSSGCSFDTISATIDSPNRPILNNNDITIENALCHGGQGSLQITNFTYEGNLSGGLTMEDFSFSIGTNSAEFNMPKELSAGDYEVKVKHTESECSSDPLAVTILEPDELTTIIEVNSAQAKCAEEGDFILTAKPEGGTSPYTFQWKQNDTELGTTLTQTAFNGTVDLFVLDGNNCGLGQTEPDLTSNLNSVNTKLIRPEVLNLFVESVLNVDSVGLSNGQVNLSALGGEGIYTYSKNGTDYFESNLFDNLNAIDYTFYVKDSRECVKNISTTITEPLALNGNFVSKKDVDCFGNASAEIELAATGGIEPFYYKLKNDKGEVIDNSSSNLFKNLRIGTYTPIVEYNGHSGNIYQHILEPIDILQPEFELQVSELEVLNSDCNQNNGSIKTETVGGTEPYTYLWNDALSQTNSEAKDLYAGKYHLVVTDKNKCTNEIDFVVNDNGGVIAELISVTDVLCSYSTEGGSIEVSITEGTEPYSVLWTDIEGGIYSSSENLPSGIFNLAVSDNKNCKFTINDIEVGKPEAISVNEKIMSPNCFEECNASITTNVSGGKGPYNYSWTDFSTVNTFIENLCAGSYSLQITDANNCVFDKVIIVNETPDIIIPIDDSVFICPGNNVLLNAENDGSDYSWVLNDNSSESSQEISVSEEGSYSLTITNEKNCSKIKNFVVKHENKLFDAAFLLVSEAYLSDTVVLIDITWPIPNEVEWSIPNSFFPYYESEAYFELLPQETGDFYISMQAELDGCKGYIEKMITILPQPETKQGEYILGSIIKDVKLFPNPNTGVFTAKIILNREADITVYLFDLLRSQKIYIKKDNAGKEYIFEYDISNSQSGVYFLIVNVEKETRKIKFIKN